MAFNARFVQGGMNQPYSTVGYVQLSYGFIVAYYHPHYSYRYRNYILVVSTPTESTH
ncbi:hypothetical protein BDQ94DRAFT_140097 [Aspergillus welwitschiae]|uniref:Uncharacterized protein n=1 Tax=Aspergillus welwitschiae TaxID=1341132 RepID=A0A3F3Q7J7_9EURO|nr:hypothetical protein BDQ94DRAFT_140097 [Aspergillus welwitschiae]RDH35017.1 hypothetical protein BDQ94DRAFT_140097 [Aspergillus welwitschiae]